MILFHTGFDEIRIPNLLHGRKNADFGQGFYLSDSGEFAGKWAKERKDRDVVINTYELDLTGLSVLEFTRDAAWFDYIFTNRTAAKDLHPEADVVIGPIANDTLYDTLGIFTSGFLTRDQALRLLMIGPVYSQTVIKTEKAAAQLHWLSARIADKAETERFRAVNRSEEQAYQTRLAEEMDSLFKE